MVPVSIVPQNEGEGSGQQQTAQNPSWSGRKKEEVTDVLLSCWTRPQGEIRKEDLFKFYKLPWSHHPKRLLSISQGRPVMMRRLQELDISVSPSQPETPKYGNCMMQSLYDQLQFDQYQKSFAMSS